MRVTGVVRSLAVLLMAAVAPAVWAIGISAEFPVSSLVLQPAGLTQSGAVVASDGSDFLVAWVDERDLGEDTSIRYSIVSPTGDVLFPLGLPLTGSQDNRPLGAFWTGSYYVLLTSGERGTGAVLIDRNGRIAQGEILIPIPSDRSPAFAYNRSNYLVAFTQLVGTQRSVAVQLRDNSFDFVRETPIATPQNGGEVVVSTVSDGTDFLVVWASNRLNAIGWDVYAVRVSATGTLLTTPLLLASTQNRVIPEVSSNGNGYLVTISEISASNSVSRVVLNANAQPLGPVSFLAQGIATGLVSAQGDYLVPVFGDLYGSDSDITLYRLLGSTGAIIGVSSLTTAEGFQGFPAGAAGGVVLFAWNDARRTEGDPTDVYFTFTDLAGTPLEEGAADRGKSVASSGATQAAPAVAFNGVNHLVAWIENPGAKGNDLYVGRISRSGVPLDGPGIRINPTGGNQYRPDVAWDGANFVVIWREGDPFESRLFAIRISSAGSVVDLGPIDLGRVNYLSGYAIASNGNGSAVLFSDLSPSGNSDLRFSRITRTGSVLDPGGSILGSVLVRPVIDLASNGVDYAAAWTTSGSAFTMNISASGVASAPSTVSTDAADPVIAAGGGRYLVAYSSRDTIRGRLLDSRAVPIAPEQIFTSRSYIAPDTRTRDLGFDGANFTLTWAFPLSPVPFGLGTPSTVSEIHVREIGRDGVPIGPAEGLLLSPAGINASEPTIAGGGGGAGVIYTRLAPDVTGVPRAFARFLTGTGIRTRQRPAKR